MHVLRSGRTVPAQELEQPKPTSSALHRAIKVPVPPRAPSPAAPAAPAAPPAPAPAAPPAPAATPWTSLASEIPAGPAGPIGPEMIKERLTVSYNHMLVICYYHVV